MELDISIRHMIIRYDEILKKIYYCLNKCIDEFSFELTYIVVGNGMDLIVSVLKSSSC